ncbi:MAG: FtsH protease activity modulator HflK [Candidatus Poribacteria bacterium]
MSFKSYDGGKSPRDYYDSLPNEFKAAITSIRNNLHFILLGFGALFIIFGIFSSFYTVQPSEDAVITRFGRYDRTTPPGLHFKLPFGIEQATKVRTKLVLQEEFGFRSRDTDRGETSYDKGSFEKESEMLTGDLNVADLEWIVQYQIADPQKFLFRAQYPRRNIRDVSEAIMRRVVGDRTVNEVLTTGRVEIATESQRLIQEVLDKYDLGIRVVTVKPQDVNPPELVKPSFNEVNAAKQEQEKAINMAEEEYNKVIPEARGKADETISEAEGYASAAVNHAKGDAERFNLMLREYRNAPDITRKRMYLETMEELFGRFEKLTIIDDKIKGLLPIFGTAKMEQESGK